MVLISQRKDTPLFNNSTLVIVTFLSLNETLMDLEIKEKHQDIVIHTFLSKS